MLGSRRSHVGHCIVLFVSLFGLYCCLPLSNDDCATAKSILLDENGQAFVVGTTINATRDSLFSECDGTSFQNEDVWYTFFSGDRNQFSASLCQDGGEVTFPAALFLMKGTCSSIECVASISGCNNGGKLDNIPLEANTYYFIVIQPIYPLDQGDFLLFTEIIKVPENQYCSAPFNLRTSDLILGHSVIGTTKYAENIALAEPTGDCDYESLKTLWYQFNSGMYSRIKISLCPSDNAFINSTQGAIFLLQGDACNSQFCVAESNTSLSCPIIEATITPSSNHRIAITTGMSFGDFKVYIKFLPEFLVSNTECTTAINITSLSHQIILGVTSRGIIPFSYSCLAGISVNNLQFTYVWYEFYSGTNTYAIISMCEYYGAYADFTAQLILLTGPDCTSLSCYVATSSSNNLCHSSSENEITLTTEVTPSTDFYLFVGNPAFYQGNFRLYFELRESPSYSNDYCLNASSIWEDPPFSTILLGHMDSFVSVEPGLPYFSEKNFNGMLWYSFYSATYNYIATSFCDYGGFAQYSASNYLFYGNCGNLVPSSLEPISCYGGGFLSYSVNGFISSETNYFIAIGTNILGYSAGNGDFGMYIELFLKSPDSNDLCEDAIVLTQADKFVTGNMYQSSNDITGNHLFPIDCGRRYYQSNIWYTFNSALNNQVSISFCDDSDMNGAEFPNYITLFTGSCRNPICVSGSTGQCYDPINYIMVDYLTTSVEANTDYWFSIARRDYPEGIVFFQFEFTLLAIAPEYDTCEMATELVLQNAVILGDVQFATPGPGPLPTCGNPTTGSFGNVWFTFYSFGATSALFSLQNNGGYANFDAVLIVYSGLCDTLACESSTANTEILIDPLTFSQYFVMVGNDSPISGDTSFALYYQFYGSTPPSNSVCNNKIVLPPPSGIPPFAPIYKDYSTWFINQEYTACSLSNIKLLWFEIATPSNAGTIQLQLEGSDLPDGFTILLFEITSCIAPFNCLASNEDGSPTLYSNLYLDTPYLLAIGNTAHPSVFHLSLLFTDAFINSECQNAQEILITSTTQLLIGDSASSYTMQAWYVFNSKFYNFFTASTCDPLMYGISFDTKLLIFTGDCEILQEFTEEDDNCEEYGTLTEISTPIAPNTIYYLSLQGSDGYESGVFRLTVTLQYFIPPNDDCTNPSEIFSGDEIIGSYIGSTISVPSTICTTSLFHPQNGDVWYYFNSGANNFAMISLCSTPASQPPVYFYMYSGLTCDSLSCVAEGDTTVCLNRLPMLSMMISTTTTYYLVIGGTTSSLQNSFTLALNLELVSTPPINDQCMDVSPIPYITGEDFILYSTTKLSTQDTIFAPAMCDGSTIENAGNVWYRFDTGNEDNHVIITLCVSDVQFAVKVHLFESTSSDPSFCANLQCVASDEDSCNGNPFIETYISQNSVFYISVGGSNAQQGDFQMVLLVSSRYPPNDQCYAATQISETSALITGPTSKVSIDYDPACSSGLSSVWFTFDNQFYNYVSFDFCPDPYFTDFAGTVIIYKGSCADLTCYNVPHAITGDCLSGSNVFYVFLDALYVNYTFAIAPSSYQGDYAFQFTLLNLKPSNDVCNLAFPIIMEGIQGSSMLSGATRDMISACGNYVGENVWFYFDTSTFDIARITFCDNSLPEDALTFDAALFLFSGTCDSRTCIAYNDDTCGIKPEITVRLSQSTRYLLSVASMNRLESSFFTFLFDLSLSSEESNDICTSAMILNVSSNPPGIPIITIAASSDPIDPLCGYSQETTMGRWYTFNTGGNNYMELSTCRRNGVSTFPVLLALFEGPCGAFTKCLPQQESCAPIGAEILTAVNPNTDYLLLVGGYYPASIGALALSFNLTFTTIPTNDLCSNAQVITGQSSLITDSIQYASADILLSGQCGGISIDGGVNIWYSFNSYLYNYVNAHFCDPYGYSSYNSKLFLYQGPSCNELTCVTGSDSGCFDNILAAGIFTYIDPMNKFYLIVTGVGNDRGSFTLDFSLENQQPPNDYCASAIRIEEDYVILYNTIQLASPDLSTPCSIFSLNYPNVWYSFNSGNHNFITIVSCGPNTPPDMTLFLYSGDCSDMDCYTADKSSCPQISTFVGLNTEYLLSISTDNEAIQTAFDFLFELTQEFPSNDDCGTALPLGASTNGFTTYANPSSFLGCGSSTNNVPDVWYTFPSGSDNYAVISLYSGYFAKMFLARGSCSELYCVDGTEGILPYISTYIQMNDYYFIVLGGFSDSFTITLELYTRPYQVNDACISALPLNNHNGIVLGSTMSATNDQLLPSCGEPLNAANVWYKFNSTTNNRLLLSFCESFGGYAVSTPIVHIFEGDCDAFTCFVGSSTPCGSDVGITINTGIEYLISVSAEIGTDFGMYYQLSEQPIPENDECGLSAGVLGASPFTQSGDTKGATLSPLDNYTCTLFSSPSNILRDVWYTFQSVSLDNTVYLSLCGLLGGSTDQPAVIRLLNSDCTSCPSYITASCGNGNDIMSYIYPEEEYYVSVGFLSGPSTDAVFSLYFKLSQTIVNNDHCDQATIITSTGSIPVDYLPIADNDADIPSRGCSVPNNYGSVWYTISTERLYNQIIIDACNTPIRVILSLFTGYCGVGGLKCFKTSIDGSCNIGIGHSLDSSLEFLT